MTKDEEKEKTAKMKAMYKELVQTMLERAGISEQEIYDTAMKGWISKNLDLLTPTELKRYKGTVII